MPRRSRPAQTASAVVSSRRFRLPSSFGLPNSITLVEEDDNRWESGFQYESLACAHTLKVRGMCDDDSGYQIYPEEGEEPEGGWYNYMPFGISVERSCPTLGMDFEKFRMDLLEGLALCTPKAVEREFWTGELAQAGGGDCEEPEYDNPYLSGPDTIDVTPPGMSNGVRPMHGLALLEDALADCGCAPVGTIHATRGTANVLRPRHDDDAEILRTKAGSLLIAGGGYPGTGPGGVEPPDNAVWMYATGPVEVRLGRTILTPESRAEAVDRVNNQVTLRADRAAAVTTDGCCIFAVLVDLSRDYT